MRAYQALWWSTTGLLSALGLLVALQALPGLLLLLMVLYMATVGRQVQRLRSWLCRPGQHTPRPASTRPARPAASPPQQQRWL